MYYEIYIYGYICDWGFHGFEGVSGPQENRRMTDWDAAFGFRFLLRRFRLRLAQGWPTIAVSGAQARAHDWVCALMLAF